MDNTKKHPCQIMYEIAAKGKIYGTEKGFCRITGMESSGVLFEKWVKPTFNDWAYLKPGTIISNEALFCFDEKSEIVREKTGRDKPQRFRTYSHIIHQNQWYCLTKADKQKIFNLIISGAELVSLTDTGQKHIFFKHKPGFWQLDEMYIKPNIPLLKSIHGKFREMLLAGFSQKEMIGGNYSHASILRAGVDKWRTLEEELKPHRGTPIFIFAAWMLFLTEEEKKLVKEKYFTKKKGQTHVRRKRKK